MNESQRPAVARHLHFIFDQFQFHERTRNELLKMVPAFFAAREANEATNYCTHMIQLLSLGIIIERRRARWFHLQHNKQLANALLVSFSYTSPLVLCVTNDIGRTPASAAIAMTSLVLSDGDS